MTQFAYRMILGSALVTLSVPTFFRLGEVIGNALLLQHDLELGQLHYPAEAEFVEAGRIPQGLTPQDKPSGMSGKPIKPTGQHVPFASKGRSVRRTLSVYSNYYLGRNMSNGKVYTGEGLTVASNDWKLGTRLKISHKGKSLSVTVTDRMAKRFSGIRVDASHRVWRELVGAKPGLRSVTVEKL